MGDVYNGPLWQQVKASDFPMTNVAAISALYGFLEPGHPIESYDRKMDDKRIWELLSTSNHGARFERMVRGCGGAFIVGGSLYRQWADGVLSRYAPELRGVVAFASGSYLEQRKQLGEWLRAHAHAPVQSELF
jgi:hypothetical protein